MLAAVFDLLDIVSDRAAQNRRYSSRMASPLGNEVKGVEHFPTTGMCQV